MECRIGQLPDGTIDLQVRLLAADSHDEAYAKAQLLGRRVEEHYINSDGEEVTWVYLGLHDLDELNDENLVDGVEVWSLRASRPGMSLVRSKHQLALFWFDANKDRTARELLGDA